jgi:hypothetical protein
MAWQGAHGAIYYGVKGVARLLMVFAMANREQNRAITITIQNSISRVFRSLGGFYNHP